VNGEKLEIFKRLEDRRRKTEEEIFYFGLRTSDFGLPTGFTIIISLTLNPLNSERCQVKIFYGHMGRNRFLLITDTLKWH